VYTSRAVTPRVTAFARSGKVSPRVEIEVPARIAAGTHRTIGGAGVVRQITVAPAGAGEARITVELTAPVVPRGRLDGRLIAIALESAAVKAAAPAAAFVSDAPAAPPSDGAPVAAAKPGASPADERGVTLALERGGARFVWPDLDAPCYADPAAAVERLALKGWRQGGMTPNAPASHTSPAGRYLAADVTYLRTLMGQIAPLEAVNAYDRALRAAPSFPDAPRALVMIGFASLRMGLAPEAATAFGRVSAEYPGSRYAPVAALGRATALRQRGRLDEARAALAEIAEPAPAGVRCEVVVERAALARATKRHADAVALDETVARDCPQFDALPSTTLDRADSLLGAGRRADARALLARPSEALEPGVQATLIARAAKLAREDGDLAAARGALERALGLRIGPGARAGLLARLVRLDGAVGPERAVARLEKLAATAPSPAVYADVIGLVAETLADAGQYEEALARIATLERSVLADSAAAIAHRDAVLTRWIERLSAADDPAGIVAVYARHRATIDSQATPVTAQRIARALERMELPEPALRILRLRDPGDDSAHALAVADAALAAGDPGVAKEVLGRLDDLELSPALAAGRGRLVARLAIADGHPERVPSDGPASDPALARELAAAWTARGDAALAAAAWDAAADAYDRARALAPDAAARLVATAGLVAVRAAAGATPASSVAADLAAVDDALARRGIALVAATRDFAVAPAETSRAR
jgi:tetratricopeptide (TPR) repeat protein